MIAYLKRFLALARSKVTTYIALTIAGLAQIADHAQGIVDAWPSLAQYVPEVPFLKKACHAVLTVLGVLVIFTRIRRELKS